MSGEFAEMGDFVDDQVIEDLQERLYFLKASEEKLRTTLFGGEPRVIEREGSQSREPSPDRLSYNMSAALSTAHESDGSGYKQFLSEKRNLIDYEFTIHNLDCFGENDDDGKASEGSESSEFTPTITIPKPFSFLSRKKSTKRLTATIAEKKSPPPREPFRAKPVPLAVIQPRYAKMLNEEAMRRARVKQESKQRLLRSQRPFSFSEDDIQNQKKNKSEPASEEFEYQPFKANEVPLSVRQPLRETQEVKERARKARIKKRAAIQLTKSRLPKRMEAWAKTGEEKKKEKLQKLIAEECKFERPKVHEVPDFQKLHSDLEHRMEARKRSQPKTVPKPFKFTTVERKKFVVHEITNEPVKKERKRIVGKPNHKIKSTKKTEQANLLRIKKEREKKQLKRQQESVRKKKEAKLKKKWSKNLKKFLVDNTKELEEKKKQTLQEAKEALQHRQREYNREKREMQSRIAQRPLLIEGEAKASEKTRTTLQKIRETMEKSGMHDVARFFNNDERKALGIA